VCRELLELVLVLLATVVCWLAINSLLAQVDTGDERVHARDSLTDLTSLIQGKVAHPVLTLFVTYVSIASIPCYPPSAKESTVFPRAAP